MPSAHLCVSVTGGSLGGFLTLPRVWDGGGVHWQGACVQGPTQCSFCLGVKRDTRLLTENQARAAQDDVWFPGLCRSQRGAVTAGKALWLCPRDP